ncbi:Tk.4 conserved hypothetical protein [Aeromonas phage Aeh1]|uniref:Macro domain-containing protein n=1 Tax=Aeromonas phage Aeh1 TaxID=2880362 RepID=Q76YF6_9CAUD|nr:Tk.4 conserved hypothetical protein [Aeromonas phage Aeh1]AAQ17939.1 Tk.4 conserved hypothetical protein [Aeromonas phage Aeh1]
MSITYVEANLIEVINMIIAKRQSNTGYKNGKVYVAQGCNCFAAMGAGFAAQVARNYPIAAAVDHKYASHFITDEEKEKNQLGTLSAAHIGGGVVMFNLYSQLHGGPDFRLDAFERAFDEMMLRIEEATEEEDVKALVLMPRIGAGIGGGKWEEIVKVVEQYQEIADFMIYDYKPAMIVSSWRNQYHDDHDVSRYMIEDIEQD